MEYKIVEKTAFKIMGISRMFSYETANTDIPVFWDEVHGKAADKPVFGMYGVCYDEEMEGEQFRYVIADDFHKATAAKKALEEYQIPEHTWAIFPCKGPMPMPIQEVNRRIFSEWLPENKYRIAEGFNIEFYSNPADFKGGTQDPEYYAEVWIPVKEKE